MKRLIKHTQKLIKGAPTAVVVSILFHAGLFMLAGAFVVFTIVKPREIEFKPPPPVKVPKMPIKKLQVKMKKPSKPKASAKITAVVSRPDLHDIQFPDLASSGIGAGLGGGNDVVSFGNMPFDESDGILGKKMSIGNDLAGVFYDFKRSRSGRNLNQSSRSLNDIHEAVLTEFFKNGWDKSVFKSFYRAPQKSYATTMLVPPYFSSMASTAFGEDPSYGYYWAAHYIGKLVHPTDITFRFWAAGDKVLAVRVDNKMVVGATWNPNEESQVIMIGPSWTSSAVENRKYFMGNTTAVVGDWITLEAGVPLDLEILIGDQGGKFQAMLAVEVKGVEYEKNRQNGPILPIFKTEELSLDLRDAICEVLMIDEVCLTNGPVFKDY